MNTLLDCAYAILKDNVRRLRPKSFRAFWGNVLVANPLLRRTPASAKITITRAEFRRALLEAFTAGKDASK